MRLVASSLVAAACLLVGTPGEADSPVLVTGPAPAALPRTIDRPEWLRVPNGAEFDEYYPKAAVLGAASGVAVLGCDINANGTLGQCDVVGGSSPELGFGASALKLSRLFKMRPLDIDANPVAGAFTVIKISFQRPDGPPPPPTATILRQVEWIGRPSLNEIAQAWPAAAAPDGGRVTLSCRARPDGTVGDCSVFGESPPDTGLGRAAQSLSSRFRMAPLGRDGAPVGGATVIIPIRFGPPPPG